LDLRKRLNQKRALELELKAGYQNNFSGGILICADSENFKQLYYYGAYDKNLAP
jgi:hypothetical protein